MIPQSQISNPSTELYPTPLSPSLQSLPIPIPPILERVLGYEGSARYFAIYWMPIGDEAIVDDGQICLTGPWHAHQAFINHPTVAPHLAPYPMGDSDTPPRYWLIIDRQERTAHIVLARAANQFLQQQHQQEQEPWEDAWRKLTPAEQAQVLINVHMAIRNDLVAYQPPSMQTIIEQMAEEDRLTAEMVAWLDAQLNPII